MPIVPSAFLPSGKGSDGRDCQYDETQHDAVHAKELEVVPLDVVHQEADGPHAHRKGHHAAHYQHGDLGAGHGSARQRELEHLEQRSTCHDRDGQIEGELCHTGAGQAQQQAAHDGGTGAGGAGDDGQALPHADEQRIGVEITALERLEARFVFAVVNRGDGIFRDELLRVDIHHAHIGPRFQNVVLDIEEELLFTRFYLLIKILEMQYPMV